MVVVVVVVVIVVVTCTSSQHIQVQGASDVVNVHDGSENEYMSKPSAKICAIEPIEDGEGYRLQYNGSGKKKVSLHVP